MEDAFRRLGRWFRNKLGLTGPLPESKKPMKGDLIKFHRAGYTHWAVYVGDDYVVHLTGDFLASCRTILQGEFVKLAEIRKEKLLSVADGDEWEISNYLDDTYTPHEVDVIVENALALVGEKRKYDLLVKNCEHLVTQLRYGIEHSQQVEDAAEKEPAVGLFRSLAEVFYDM